MAGDVDTENPASISSDQLLDWRRSSNVEFIGHCKNIHEIMSISHVVCLPSYYPEGLPKVLCEAAAAGRPVITTDTPGCRDAVIESVTGILIPPRDSWLWLMPSNTLL